MDEMQIYRIRNDRVVADFIAKFVVAAFVGVGLAWWIWRPLGECVKDVWGDGFWGLAAVGLGIGGLLLAVTIVGGFLFYCNVRGVIRMVHLFSCRVVVTEAGVRIEKLIGGDDIGWEEMRHILGHRRAITLVWEKDRKVEVFSLTAKFWGKEALGEMKAAWQERNGYVDDAKEVARIVGEVNSWRAGWE